MKLTKKITIIALILCLLFPCALAANEADVLLRPAFESIGVTVKWSDGGLIDLLVDYLKIECSVGSEKLSANGRTYKASAPVYIENERAYIAQDAVALIKNIVLYNRAAIDAIIADEDEILPLKSITGTEDVLVCTWHKYPDSYKSGETVTTKYGEVWVFTAEEIEEFMKNNKSDNMVLRLEQLIGLPPQKGNTHFSFLWVNPADLFRPAPDSEITDTTVQLTFPDTSTFEHKAWFNGNCIYS